MLWRGFSGTYTDTEGCAQAYAPLGGGGTNCKSVAVFTDTVLPTIIPFFIGDCDLGEAFFLYRPVLCLLASAVICIFHQRILVKTKYRLSIILICPLYTFVLCRGFGWHNEEMYEANAYGESALSCPKPADADSFYALGMLPQASELLKGDKTHT